MKLHKKSSFQETDKKVSRVQRALRLLPWVISLIFLGLFLFSVLPQSQEESFQDLQKEYPFIDPASLMLPKEARLVNITPLRDDLKEFVEKNGPDAISVYIEYLNTGANITINTDIRIWPASLSKLPLAMAVMKKVEREKWKMSNELVLTQGDRDTEWGDLYNKAYGTRFTIEELLKELLINSDNTAYRILYRNMEGEELKEVIDEIGLQELFNEEGKVTAKEYSRLFRALYNSSYLNRNNSQLILEWLTQSPYKEYLKQDLPDEIPFAHKIGENREVFVYSDSGIMFLPNRPFLITVMIDGNVGKKMSREQALDVMGTIAKKAYEYFATVKH